MNENYFGLYAVGVLAIVMLFIGARAIDDDGRVRIGQGDPVPEPIVERSRYGDELLVMPSRGGSFLTEAMLDGAPIDVLIDTGASYTTLRESDALRAGINPRSNEFVHTFSTANGEVKAARAEIQELELGPAVLSGVTVFIIPDDKLSVSLLGMNVLRTFDRIEMTPDGLRLSLD